MNPHGQAKNHIFEPHRVVHWPDLPGVGTDHPNVCYYPGLVWISPLGRIYHTQPPPIIDDLPDPQPGPPYPSYPPPVTVEGLPILHHPPPQPDPPPAPPVDPDEPPPF